MKSLALICALLLITTTPAARAMVVSDPTSYSYYVQQIKELAKQTQEAIKQVETAGGILTEAQKLNSQITGTYNRAVGLQRQVTRLTKRLNSEPTTIQGHFRKWSGTVGDLSRIAGGAGSLADRATGNYVDVREFLDENFEDPRTRKDSLSNAPNYAPDVQYQLHQASLRRAVIVAEESLQEMPEKIETLETLAGDIDNTENIKDATDLTNRFLGEILKAIYELTAITAYFYEAQSLQNYSGVDEATTAARLEAAEAAANRPETFLHRKELEEIGISFDADGKINDPDATKKALGLY